MFGVQRKTRWPGPDMGNCYPFCSTASKIFGLGVVFALVVSLQSAPSKATTASATFAVTANVQATCLVSAGALAFGIYSGMPINSTATITVTCTNGTPYYVNIGNGLHQDANFYPRMIGPAGQFASYRFYQDAARTIGWRNTYNLDGRNGTGNGSAQLLTAYGQLIGGQFVTPGSYTDTVTVTVTF